jgi:hypothetical protein
VGFMDAMYQLFVLAGSFIGGLSPVRPMLL